MATTEERLAALEAKMAQLTTTTPTTYYTHQYSGEEIDAAVGRALTGGALDTSVTNVSNQLGTLVRPNLLDNWYFGRPVDQRGGKIIQQGVNIYADSALKTLIGPAAYACPVVELTSTYAKVQDAKNTSNYYYAAPADVVRGYTGNGYTIDRWKMEIDIGTVTVDSDGIILDGGAHGITLNQQSGTALVEALRGKIVTQSVMYTVLQQTGAVGGFGTEVPGQYIARVLLPGTIGAKTVSSATITMPDNLHNFAWFYLPPGCKIKIHAVKVELGPTQTLAHQDVTGKWVLNEVPEYGGQLRRCQRYFYRVNSHAYGWTYNNNTVNCLIPLPVTLRTSPVITLNESGTINTVKGDASMTSYEVKNAKPNGLIIDLHNSANALTTGTPVVWHNFDIDISADL